MKHIILGAGNLGQDLALELEGAGHEVKLLKREDFSYPRHNVGYIGYYDDHFNADVIWNCIGCGSVNEGINTFSGQFSVSAGLTQKLVKFFPDKTVITFSSDYAREPKSLYGLNKKFQDQLVEFLQGQGASIRSIRVTGLYGSHFPEKGLPLKLLKNNYEKDYVDFPSNKVCLTPTDWLAERIVKDLDLILSEKKIFSIAPAQPVQVRRIAILMLEEVGECLDGLKKKYGTKGFDTSRPSAPIMDHNLAHECEDTCLSLLVDRLPFYKSTWASMSH